MFVCISIAFFSSGHEQIRVKDNVEIPQTSRFLRRTHVKEEKKAEDEFQFRFDIDPSDFNDQ